MLRLQTHAVRGLTARAQVLRVKLCVSGHPMSDEGSKVIRSVYPAPLATIRTLAEDFASFAVAQHRNDIVSVNGICLSVLVRPGVHLRKYARKFSMAVDIGVGIG